MPKQDDPTEIEPRPQPAPPDAKPNPMELERDIDAGATGDKVPMLDPASAPLGTDAEAAGVPPSPAAVKVARETERSGPRSPLDPTDRREDRGGFRLIWLLVIVVVLGLLAALVGLT